MIIGILAGTFFEFYLTVVQLLQFIIFLFLRTPKLSSCMLFQASILENNFLLCLSECHFEASASPTVDVLHKPALIRRFGVRGICPVN